MPLCSLVNVKKSYFIGDEEVEILRGISLEIEAGEFLALMGPSGSGKTTLMNILGCLDVPSSGEYIFAHQRVSELSDDELSTFRNEHMGFVFQNFHLLPYATVLENVLLPTLYVAGRREADPRKRARDLLRLVGLEEREKFKPGQLSGGQQQRVAIARALVNDPRLILADEPTGQLDSRTAGEIMEILRKMRERGKTVVVITHDPATAAYAQRKIHIRDGLLSD